VPFAEIGKVLSPRRGAGTGVCSPQPTFTSVVAVTVPAFNGVSERSASTRPLHHFATAVWIANRLEIFYIERHARRWPARASEAAMLVRAIRCAD
jgi:hypothetical protein